MLFFIDSLLHYLKSLAYLSQSPSISYCINLKIAQTDIANRKYP